MHTEQVQNKFEVLLAGKGDENKAHSLLKTESDPPIRLISNVGEVVDHFQEREAALESLKKKLQTNQIVVLTGVAGCGKTQLATRYLEEFKREHPESIIWKFRTDTSELLKASYEDLALRLGILKDDFARLQTAQIKNYVEERLLYWGKQGRECILFFDNADDQEIIDELKSLLPSSSAGHIRVLITSQNSMFYQEIDKILYLGDGFTLNEVESFLHDVNGPLDSKHNLMNEFSCLPLGLAAAKIYIKDSSITIIEYLELLAAERKIIEEYEDKKMQPFYGKGPGQSSQIAAIRLAINKVGGKDPLAKALLEAAAYLSPVRIPLVILQEIVATTHGRDVPSATRAYTNNYIGWLNSYSLIKVEGCSEQRAITLHSITQAAARTQFTPEQRKGHLNIVLQVLGKYLSKDNLQQQSWLTPHILTFIRYIEVINLDQAEKSNLLRSIDRHFIGTHIMREELTDEELKELIKTLELLLEMKIQCYRTTEHDEVVRTMLILAHFLEKNMQNHRAYCFNSEILVICNSLVINAPESFIAYRNRGITHFNLRNYTEAVKDFTQSIKLNPIYSSAYYNRAITYIELGKIESAFNDFKRVIQYENNYLAYYYCGLINYKLSNNFEALRNFTRTVELNPAYTRAYRCRARIYLSSGLFEQAAADMLSSASLDPSFTIDVLASPLTKSEYYPYREKTSSVPSMKLPTSNTSDEKDTQLNFLPLPGSFSTRGSPQSPLPPRHSIPNTSDNEEDAALSAPLTVSSSTSIESQLIRLSHSKRKITDAFKKRKERRIAEITQMKPALQNRISLSPIPASLPAPSPPNSESECIFPSPQITPPHLWIQKSNHTPIPVNSQIHRVSLSPIPASLPASLSSPSPPYRGSEYTLPSSQSAPFHLLMQKSNNTPIPVNPQIQSNALFNRVSLPLIPASFGAPLGATPSPQNAPFHFLTQGSNNTLLMNPPQIQSNSLIREDRLFFPTFSFLPPTSSSISPYPLQPQQLPRTDNRPPPYSNFLSAPTPPPNSVDEGVYAISTNSITGKK